MTLNTFTGMTIIFIANAFGPVKLSVPPFHCFPRLAYQLTFWVCFHVELSLLYASCSFSPEPAPKSQRNILRTMLENTEKKKEATVYRGGENGGEFVRSVRCCQFVPVTAPASHDLCVTMRYVNYLYTFRIIPTVPYWVRLRSGSCPTWSWKIEQKKNNSQTLNCWRDPRHSEGTLASNWLALGQRQK